MYLYFCVCIYEVTWVEVGAAIGCSFYSSTRVLTISSMKPSRIFRGDSSSSPWLLFSFNMCI